MEGYSNLPPYPAEGNPAKDQDSKPCDHMYRQTSKQNGCCSYVAAGICCLLFCHGPCVLADCCCCVTNHQDTISKCQGCGKVVQTTPATCDDCSCECSCDDVCACLLCPFCLCSDYVCECECCADTYVACRN